MSGADFQARARREAVLGAIRSALGKAPADAGGALIEHPARGMFAAIRDPLERFLTECAANRTEVIAVNAEQEAAELQRLLAGVGGRLYAQDAPELRQLLRAQAERVQWSSEASCDENHAAGITLAEALIAQTGSVAVSARHGGRAISVLPPLHIVRARRAQLAPDLETALAWLAPALQHASMACIITGPSRTADIEKLLVLGAHGPRRLVVLLRMDE